MIEAENRVTKFNTLYQKGLDLLTAGKDDEAMAAMHEAAKTAPEGWLALAVQFIKDGQGDVAIARLKEVLALTNNPKVKAAALNNIGMVLANRGQNASALEAFREASTLCPEIADTWSNIGLMHKWAGDFDTALRYIDRALRCDPWHEQGNFVRAMVYLLSGDYVRGFEEYECRWRSKSNGLAKINTPHLEWDGKSGSSLLVYGEQGFGDAILSLRYASQIRAMGVQQSWVCQKSMVPVLRAVDGINNIVPVGEILPDFDCHIPAVSLPRVMRTTAESVPLPEGYINRPSDPVDYGPGFHVGIVWRGSRAQGNDLFRSTSLDDWEPVLAVEGVTFHPLQTDNLDEALLYPQISQDAKSTDWGETMRRVAGLDLVISVDTSMVHLCGAMGVECWCAMHCRPYFVYPPKFGERTPWYKSVRLYRQDRELNWKPVMERIANDLRNTAKGML